MKLLQQHNKKWWSVWSITSIVVSRLLIMLRSSLTESFQLHNRIFHEQFRSWHCGEEFSEAAGSGCVMRRLLIFIEHSFLQSPLDTLWSLTDCGTGMVIVFCQRPWDEAKFRGGIFHSKSKRVGKKRSLSPYTKLPCSPIRVLLHPDGCWGFLW